MTNIYPFPSASCIKPIPESEVTLGRLCDLLPSLATYSVNDEGQIFVSAGLQCPLWIEIDSERRLLCFSSYYPLDSDATQSPLLAAINTLNANHILVQFHLCNDHVFGMCWISYENCLVEQHFNALLEQFSNAFSEGITHLLGIAGAG